MYQVLNSTSKTQRKGFVIILNPQIYNKIAEEIIFPKNPAISPILIHYTPEGVIIEKSILENGQEYKAVTKIQDFKVEGDYADSVSTYMEEVKTCVFTNVYDKAKEARKKETEFSR